MASLTTKQKNNIKELKLKISNEAFTVAKIQSTTPVEQELLQEAINYIATDKIGDYEGRMSKLNKYHYMIQGILYAHLDSGQVCFGKPQSIIVAPNPLIQRAIEEEPIGAELRFYDDETTI